MKLQASENNLATLKNQYENASTQADKAKQAQARLKMIERMDFIAAPEEAARRVFTFPEPEELSPPILATEGVNVGYDGKPVLRKAYGPADLEWGVPNGVTTRFDLASLDQMFTAVVVAKQVEEGKLAFEDAIGEHLEGWVAPEVGAAVTVHHLLTHTSGIPEFTGLWLDSWQGWLISIPLRLNTPSNPFCCSLESG